MNYKRELPYELIFDKKTPERSKNEDINRKRPKKLKNKDVPILKLKRIFRLCKTLWYQFPRFTFQYSIESKLFQQKTK